jgi:hypothetical protein
LRKKGKRIQEHFAELIDVEEESFLLRYQDMVEQMKVDGKWFRARGVYKGSLLAMNHYDTEFEEISTKRHLAIGRSTYYDEFINARSRALHYEVFQSDYLVWINPRDPYESLLYYINTAECIDVNLQGVPGESIALAVEHRTAAASRRILKSPFMTVWEINQILFSPNLNKTMWFVHDDQNLAEVRQALESLVEVDKIAMYPGNSNGC